MLSNILLLMALSKELVGWTTLSDVTLNWKYVEKFGEQVEIPVFGQSLRSKEGQEFVVSGYFMPAEVEGNGIILSKMSYASCFFCGSAGIDSVIEIRFDKKQRNFKLDEIVKVSGILDLNDSDFDHLIFILKHAKIVE